MLGVLSPRALDAVVLTFNLADGRTLRAQRQQTIDDRTRKLKSWVGTFEEQPGSLAVLGTYRGTTTGFISYGAELWEIRPAPSDPRQLVLYRFDDRNLPTAEPSLVTRKPPAAMSTPIDYASDEPTPEMLEAGYVQDLLVVYTPASRKRYGQATLESMIQNAVQAANQAYRNSGVAISLDLVGLQEVAYVENGDMKASLKALQTRKDGQLDAVHALRSRLGADVVTLIAEDSGLVRHRVVDARRHPERRQHGVQCRECRLPQQPVARARGRPQPGQHARPRQHVERRRVRVLVRLPELRGGRQRVPERHGVLVQGWGPRCAVLEPAR